MFAQTAKIIMGALCILVLALLLGSTTTEGKTVPLMLLGGLVLLAAIIGLGKKVWWLLLLLPAVAIPIPGLGFLPKPAIAVLIALPAMLALGAMGKFKFTWHSLPLLDFLMVLLLGMLVQAYVRNPASIAMFSDMNTEYIGGKEYILFLFAFLSYITYSMVPADTLEIRRLLKYTFMILVGFTVYGLLSGQIEMAGANENVQLGVDNAMTETRYGRFVGLGLFLTTWLISRYSLTQVVMSIWRLPLYLLGVICVLLSGFREQLVSISLVCIFASVVRRNYLELAIAGLACFLFLPMLGVSGLAKELPFGVQRSLSVLPFMEVSRDARDNAEQSSEWRKEMWEWAWDDRAGYIVNRMWGDGFRLKVEDVKNESEMIYRGQIVYGDLELFARAGQWHNGPIECINRVGYVGLVVCSLLMLAMVVVIIRACRVLLGFKEDYVAIYLLVPVIANIALWALSAGTMYKLSMLLYSVAFAKLLYCVGLKEGYLSPMWKRSNYVPLMIRDVETQKRLPV